MTHSPQFSGDHRRGVRALLFPCFFGAQLVTCRRSLSYMNERGLFVTLHKESENMELAHACWLSTVRVGLLQPWSNHISGKSWTQFLG